MPPSSRIHLISRVARSARKRLGLTQGAVANAIGVSQATISRLEAGRQEISAREWIRFCQLTQIPYESCVLGYIDRGTRGVLITADDSAWAIPKRYVRDRGSKVRANRVFLDFAQAVWGERKTQEFLKHQGFDPDFFVDYDNQLTYQFVCDLIEALIADGSLGCQSLPLLANGAANYVMNGSMRSYLQQAHGIEATSEKLAQAMDHLDVNLAYSSHSVAPGTIAYEVKPRPHLEQFTYSEEAGTALAEYRIQGWMGVLKKAVPTTQYMQFIQQTSVDHGDDRWTYLILAQ